MKVYVVGAGVSKTVGYPLGGELSDEVNRYIRGSGRAYDRFDYKKVWPALCDWLEKNKNPLIKEAYRTKQIEQLFTILDQAAMLKRSIAENAVRQRGKEANQTWANYESFDTTTENYQKYRSILLWALETYLQFKHRNDVAASQTNEWNNLRAFGRKLCRSDVVITFNYDSTLERVLLQGGKWSPHDGYGFELVFQKSESDQRRVRLKKSQIKVLHLHGAVGWYKRRVVRDNCEIPSPGGVIPEEALTPAPIGTMISLDPDFLRDLGVEAVDASLPTPPADERQIFLHPSFFKDFELEGPHGQTSPFIELWKKAAESLRKAEQIFIIGYSLPSADSAALTLLLTNCDREKVRIINPDGHARLRLIRLLSGTFSLKKSFEDWLKEVPDCPK